MGLFHPDDPIALPRTGGPKWSSSITGEFQDTMQPEHWRKHDAQAAYDPDAMPVQDVRNPCEGDDDLRPGGFGAVLAVWLAGGVVVVVGTLAVLGLANKYGWL